MKLEFQNKWVRLLIEIFPSSLPAIRRYRVVPTALEGPTRRFLHRQISGRLRGIESEGTR